MTYYKKGILIRSIDEISWLDTNISSVEIYIAEKDKSVDKNDLIINHKDHIIKISSIAPRIC